MFTPLGLTFFRLVSRGDRDPDEPAFAVLPLPRVRTMMAVLAIAAA